jgi:tetratricopeptide (TPR) repeat protein
MADQKRPNLNASCLLWCRVAPRANLLCGLVLLLICGCRFTGQGRNIDGVRQYQQGQYQAAIQKFQQSLVVNPQNADAYYNLAATYYAMGKANRNQEYLAQAEQLYHQCLDLQPNHTACHRGLAALLVDTNRPDAAFTLLKRWTAREPALADPRIELARLYEEFGDKATASQHLSEALHVDARNARAWSALGRIREQQGQVAQALSDYQQAYALNRDQKGLSERIAMLQRSLPPAPSMLPAAVPQLVTIPTTTVPR